MDNKLKGRIIDIFETQQIKDTFKKREFVIETDEQYPQLVKLELVQDNCTKLDSLDIGQEVTAHFNVRGRKWTNKEGKDNYFISLNVWRIEVEKAESKTQPVSTATDLPPVDDSVADDLPF